MKHYFFIAGMFFLLAGCMSPGKILKEYGNVYNYSRLSPAGVGFCAPLVASASINLNDNSKFLKPVEFHDEEAANIRNSFYAQLKQQIRMHSLPWKLLNDTLNAKVSAIRISDSMRTATLPDDLKSGLQTVGVTSLILIYDIKSSHSQTVSMVQTAPRMAPNGTMFPGFSQQVASIDIDFTYSCAIIDVQSGKLPMFVKMHESSSSPLNFYDEVCENLFGVLLYTEK